MTASQGKMQLPKPAWFLARQLGLIVIILLFSLLIAAVLVEMHSSRWQAHFFSNLASQLSYRLQAGPSKAIRFPPSTGPYDQRMGYAELPHFVERLQKHGYKVSAQARQSPRMIELFDRGLFLPYREKDQAGLLLRDRQQQTIYSATAPERAYAGFGAIPPTLVNTLLYIENNSLLDPETPLRNPAVEWSRFGRALSDEAVHLVDPAYHPPGGSTLATQIEKYRHSAEGRTSSPREKLRQMLSASVRAYLQGEDTTAARQQLVVDYLNTVPLAARAGFGEVAGIGDGLWIWYGRDFAHSNALLRDDSKAARQEKALVYKEALSLMISQRRPSYYLGGDMQVLENLSNTYLRLLASAHIISQDLCNSALGQSLRQQKEAVRLPGPPPTERKGINAVRSKLAGLLGLPLRYDLDRLDLAVDSTLDSALQQAVTAELLRLRQSEHAYAVGLKDEHLLQEGDPQGVTYSFTLLERTPQGNKVRVQADNFDQPLDINDGSKLDLGSTAKLRTLVNYLDIISTLHHQYAGMPTPALSKIHTQPNDVLRRWAIDHLIQQPDSTLADTLAASLQRQYSANPGESFFTGGGLHVFANFDKTDNGRVLSVREATQRSVNLVYIRLMRDMVHYYMELDADSSQAMLQSADSPARQRYLQRFADREGRTFLSSFYHKYQGKDADQASALLLENLALTPRRLAVIYRSIAPDATLDEFTRFVGSSLPAASKDQALLARLYHDYAPERYSLQDRSYLARVHPLELWLLAYLRNNPDADYGQVIRDSAEVRQQAYQWLFSKKRKPAQDKRIRELLETDGFVRMQKAWQRLGYPFDSLVPSYATALGASADRPAALAELMGILVNNGLRLPVLHIDTLHFAAGTPYETVLQTAQPTGQQVLSVEITSLVRQVLSEVVEKGTARRVANVFKLPDGRPLMVGGKTGTGDNRFKTFAKGGGVVSERVVSRSGAFVFYLGDRYFGTLLAYVAGPQAAHYQFTSALPVQILKVLAPQLQPRLDFAGSPAAVDMPMSVATNHPVLSSPR